MLNGVTMKINIDEYILNALKEDITSEDVTTNAIMPEEKAGKADLICKEDGVICGLGLWDRCSFIVFSKYVHQSFPSS